jgi:enamine deaminase RidA (YjgF/YER057c/UK114 family)
VGQIPADNNGKLHVGIIEEKTALFFKNIQAILEAAGPDMSQMVRITVYIYFIPFHFFTQV